MEVEELAEKEAGRLRAAADVERRAEEAANCCTGEGTMRAIRTGLARAARSVLVIAVALAADGVQAQAIHQAILGEPSQRTPEVSTEELRRVLAEGTATVLDTRPFLEYAVSHIPGARNVAAKPGVPMSMYVSDVAEIARITGNDKTEPLVLYCNGPFCGKSKRLAEELLAAGFTNIRRYQLGIPVWRALGGVCEIELDGLRHVLAQDRTAVLIDVREAEDFRKGTLPGARNIPRSLVLDGKDVGEVRKAKDDGRLPMQDHNTRVIVIAADSANARYVADAIAREAFHNVTYFSGTVHEARAAVSQ